MANSKNAAPVHHRPPEKQKKYDLGKPIKHQQQSLPPEIKEAYGDDIPPEIKESFRK